MSDCIDDNMIDDHPLHNKSHNTEIVKIALRYPCLREYSEKELQQKIQNKQIFSPEEFAHAFDYLKSKNYLSEERYIRQKSNILKIKGYSTQYIVKFLNSEQIFVTHDQIEELELESNEQQIKKLILKKTTTDQIMNLTPKKKNSIIRYICSKGHSYGEVVSVIKSMNCTL